MRSFFLILSLAAAIILVQSKAVAQKAVLVEEAKTDGLAIEDGAKQVGKNVETKTGSFLREKKSLKEVFTGEYDSTYSMRSDRRVGVGLQAGGQLGLFGVNAELNFALDDSALLGFGGGPKYSSFEMGWRHVFAGRALAPYVGAAYTRWYNSSNTSGSISDTTPNFLGQKFLNSDEAYSGKFGVNLLVPSAGIQYNLLSGDYVGTSLYAEVMMLLSVDNFQNVITGAFGATYYF